MHQLQWAVVLNVCPLDRRGLRFIQVFLQSICDGERDENHPNLIRVNANKAYEMALKKYHGWLVQKIFKVSATVGTGGLRLPPLPSLTREAQALIGGVPKQAGSWDRKYGGPLWASYLCMSGARGHLEHPSIPAVSSFKSPSKPCPRTAPAACGCTTRGRCFTPRPLRNSKS